MITLYIFDNILQKLTGFLSSLDKTTYDSLYINNKNHTNNIDEEEDKEKDKEEDMFNMIDKIERFKKKLANKYMTEFYTKEELKKSLMILKLII